MQLLKQSTAATTIVGPILDSAGAEYASAVIGDLSITKNGTTAAMAAAATLTIIANGYYTLVFTTGNTDTLGRLDVTCNKATYQMPPARFSVLPAAMFNSYHATSGGVLPNAAADAAGGLPISDAGGLDLDVKLANTNEVTVARMGALTDWIDGGRLDVILDGRAATGAQMDLVNAPNATAVTAIQSGLATAASLATLAAKFVGITLLADWLRRAFRKDSGTAGMATAETEINTGGTATFVGTTDNLEAIKDAGGAGLTEQNITDISAAVTGPLKGRTIVVQSPLDGLRVTLYTDADYTSATQRLLITNLTGAGWPNGTTYNALKLVVRCGNTKTAYGTGAWIVTSGAGAQVAFSIPSEDMAAMKAAMTEEHATIAAWAYITGDAKSRFPLLPDGKLNLVDVPWVD